MPDDRRYVMSRDAVISLHEAVDIYPGRRETVRQLLRDRGVVKVDALDNEVVIWGDVIDALVGTR